MNLLQSFEQLRAVPQARQLYLRMLYYQIWNCHGSWIYCLPAMAAFPNKGDSLQEYHLVSMVLPLRLIVTIMCHHISS